MSDVTIAVTSINISWHTYKKKRAEISSGNKKLKSVEFSLVNGDETTEIIIKNKIQGSVSLLGTVV